MSSFSQCSDKKKLEKQAPVTIDQPYFQRWTAGVEGGGSGMNIHIPVSDVNIVLDSVYFRGRVAPLELKKEAGQYVGRFSSDFNKKKDMIMNEDPKEEYGNTMPEKLKPIPFELKDNECVISYRDGKTVKYFMLSNVVEKPLIAYPSAPPIKQ
ncbi:MAG: hypothetical protein KJO00_04605 [Bacteroidia bacterium]|nr:hypothetical protein [Bacteroidia bacterium]MBT8287274.1 hypothetical protein [Bacteroidia bacterium]